MLDFLIDNIFVQCGGLVFQQMIGIPMGRNCASLLADLLLYAYETDFLQGLLKNKDRKLAETVVVLPQNNSRFGDYLHLIYPNELDLKDTTDTYIDLHL